jgi:hypothetical protein
MAGFAIHGLGINFKSSIIERFVERHPEFTPKYSTNSRLNEIKKYFEIKN